MTPMVLCSGSRSDALANSSDKEGGAGFDAGSPLLLAQGATRGSVVDDFKLRSQGGQGPHVNLDQSVGSLRLPLQVRNLRES